MNSFSQKYESVVLRDATDPKYVRNSKILFVTWSFFMMVMIWLYVEYFHASLIRNLKFIQNAYHVSIRVQDPGMKTFVFIYNYVFIFQIFLLFFVVFIFIGLWGYDMHRRNSVIRRLSNSSPV